MFSSVASRIGNGIGQNKGDTKAIMSDTSSHAERVYSREVTEDTMQRRRELVRDISRYCGGYRPGQREIVLVLGRTGVGKSAALNTVMKVVNGEYLPLAKIGRGVAATKSKELLLYKNCGVRTNMARRNIGIDEEDEFFLNQASKLPHLIDFAGLADADTPGVREIFELLVGGYIPPGTTIEALERDQKRFGVGKLKGKYSPKPEWRVTKVVFVHSCLTPVPSNLIRCLLASLHATDDRSSGIKYTGDVFLLVSKYDLVDGDQARAPARPDQGASDVTGEASRSISMDEFVKREKELAEQFSIEGALEFNRLRWTSYCTDTGYNNENIDLIALNFLKLMVTPKLERDFEPPKADLVTDLKMEAQRGAEKVIEGAKKHIGLRDILTFLCFAVLLVIIGMLMFK